MKKRAPKEIANYTHREPALIEQQPDLAPGPYYVSVKDGTRFWLMSGPYVLHADALAVVDVVRGVCVEAEPFAAFYSFGTVRMAESVTRPGNLQQAGYDLHIQREEKKEKI